MHLDTDLPRPPGVEQRAHRRQAVSLRCRVDDGTVTRFTRLANLGLGGARVITASPPTVGTEVAIRFKLRHDGPVIDGRARVVWRVAGYRGRGGMMGIQFLSLSSPMAQEVADFVK